MKYDVAIIGAGADGLGAAIQLARAGRKVVVIERQAQAGGRLQTRQFRPGFFASPFLDNVPEIPPPVLERLEVALRPTGAVPAAIREALFEARTAAFGEAALRPPGRLFATVQPGRKLFDRGHADAEQLPRMPGLPRVEPVRGGLGSLASAFGAAALSEGVELRFGLAAVDVLVEKNILGRPRASGVLLADGSWIDAAAVISTLDLRQSMFSWRLMPPILLERARVFPMAGHTARLLLALARPVGEAVLTLAGDANARTEWRQHRLPTNPPLTFDPVSARDPGLAPEGAAVATVTLDCIPCRLADGAWTHRRRIDLAARTLARLAPHRQNLVEAVRAVEIIVPPDIAEALGVTEGDLDGGALDQAAGPGPRTILPRFYLGGASTPASRLGTGAAGLAAALAVLAD